MSNSDAMRCDAILYDLYIHEMGAFIECAQSVRSRTGLYALFSMENLTGLKRK